MDQYVNDRPYVASSFPERGDRPGVRQRAPGDARSGPSWLEAAIPLKAPLAVAAVPRRRGDACAGSSRPLGYEIVVARQPLDPSVPGVGREPYFNVKLRADRADCSDLLRHLYVLVPVLDDDKHYWVGDDEVDKLLRHGEGWLAAHPERELIADRYLKRQRSLTREALARLSADDAAGPGRGRGAHAAEEEPASRRRSASTSSGSAPSSPCSEVPAAKRVLDLGCGEGSCCRRS